MARRLDKGGKWVVGEEGGYVIGHQGQVTKQKPGARVERERGGARNRVRDRADADGEGARGVERGVERGGGA